LPRRYLVWFLLFVIAVQFPIPRLIDQRDVWWYTRSDGFAWGVLLALAIRHRLYALCEPVFLNRFPARIVFLGVTILALVSTTIMEGVAFFTGIAIMAAASLVFAASFGKNYLIRQTHLRKTAVWIGTRTYSLYLANDPAYAIILRITDHIPRNHMADILIMAAAVALNFALAEINYRLIETPFRRKGRAAAEAFLQKRFNHSEAA
jgi:peptidoglycan/LPS O-acetylase OafA/YrhL